MRSDALLSEVRGSTVSAERGVSFSERRRLYLLATLFFLLLAAGLGGLLVGSYELNPAEVVTVLAQRLTTWGGEAFQPVRTTIVWEIRLPRILVAVLVGFALGAAGTTYQGTFRNPLVEPFILGVSAGASFGASLGILYPSLFASAYVSALIFALAAVAIVYATSRIEGRNPIVALILTGVIVSSLFQALVSILKYTSDDAALRAIVFWIMGGFYYSAWKDVTFLAPVILGGTALLWLFSWKLNVLSMGDEEARSLGINPDRTKLVLITLATLITAVSVASVGVIAWVGLIVPHAARMILGPDNRFVIPASALMGGFYLLLCDTLARTLTGAEIPVSIVTSILGAPYLLYLIRRRGAFGFAL